MLAYRTQLDLTTTPAPSCPETQAIIIAEANQDDLDGPLEPQALKHVPSVRL